MGRRRRRPQEVCRPKVLALAALSERRTLNHAAEIHKKPEEAAQPYVEPRGLSFSASRYGEPATFGEFIGKARLEKGLKQVEVAWVVGVEEMTIVKWDGERVGISRLIHILNLPRGAHVPR